MALAAGMPMALIQVELRILKQMELRTRLGRAREMLELLKLELTTGQILKLVVMKPVDQVIVTSNSVTSNVQS